MNEQENNKKSQPQEERNSEDVKQVNRNESSDPNAGIVYKGLGYILQYPWIYVPLFLIAAFLRVMNLVVTQGTGDASGIVVIIVCVFFFLLILIIELIVVCFFVILLLAYEALAKQLASMFLYEKVYYEGTDIDSLFVPIFSYKVLGKGSKSE